MEIEIKGFGVVEVPDETQAIEAINAFHANPNAGTHYDTVQRTFNNNTQSIEPIESTLRDRIFNRAIDFFFDPNDDPIARQKAIRYANNVTQILDFTGVGDLMDASEAYQAFGDGRLLDGAILSGIAALGIIPVVGNAGRDILRSPEVRDAARSAAKKLNLWHGSPHKFDRFDFNKIDTGEGAQSFGHGGYLTESREIGQNYADNLADSNPRSLINNTKINGMSHSEFRATLTPDELELFDASLLQSANHYSAGGLDYPDLGNDFTDDFKDVMNSEFDLYGDNGFSITRNEAATASLSNKINSISTNPSSNLYNVDLDVDPNTMLDWDAPLSEQPENVRKVAEYFGIKTTPSGMKEAKGSDIYRAISASEQRPPFDNSTLNPGNVEGSAYLNQQGIPGIRYLDGSSRMKTGGEVLGATQNADGQWISSIRKQGVSNWSNSSPSDYVTTKSMPFGTEQEAMDWANSQISQGTRNYVVFDDANLNILSRNGQPLSAPLDARSASPVPYDVTNYAELEVDPRFAQGIGTSGGSARVGELNKFPEFQRTTEGVGQEFPELSLADLEGRPFVAGISDRTEAGSNLTGMGGVDFNSPVPLQGGQDFMFNNPGSVWAVDKTKTNPYMRMADALKEAHGVDPLWMPFRMAPTGSDFSTMTGETLIAYASANMTAGPKRSLNSQLKKVVDGWTSVDDPMMVDVWRGMNGSQRKSATSVFDTFRDKGGASVSQARLAISDPRQINAPDWELQNIGELNPSRGVVESSGHNTYNTGIPGQGLGRLKENVSIFDLIAEQLRAKGDGYTGGADKFSSPFLRHNPVGGVITSDILKNLGL